MGTTGSKLAFLARSAAAAAVVLSLHSEALAGASLVQVINARARTSSVNSSIDLPVPFSGVAAGNSILIALQAGSPPGTLSCSDPINGTYDTDVVSAEGSARIAIVSKHGVAALSFGDVIRCTYPLFSGASSASAYEFTGLEATATLDQTAQNASSSAGAASSGLTAVTLQPDELVFGSFWLSNPAPTQTFAIATSGSNPPETPYAPPYAQLFAAGTQRTAYRFVSAIRQYEVNGTVAGTGDWWAQVATYRLAPDPCNGVSCDDGNVCTVDSCDPATGLCSNVAGNSGIVCRPAAGECDRRERCDGVNAACPEDAFVEAEAPCGDSNDTGDCDHADSCDGLGACQNNRAADGAACGDPGSACVHQDTCQGGFCQDQGFAAAGAACGDPASGACDAADGCDGAGGCLTNLAPDGSECGDAGSACVNQDTCQNGVCQDQGFVAAGSACGDFSSGPCDSPDTCDGAGGCQSNPADAGTACSDDDACTAADACDGSGACVGGGPPAEACGNGIDDDCDGEVDDGCDQAGPVTTLTMASPNPVSVSSPTTLTAHVDDSATGNATVASAAYNVEGGAYDSMQADDGAFDEVGEDVVRHALTFPSTGVYRICVHGTDAHGNTGGDDCTYLAVYDPEGGFVTGGGWIPSAAGAYPADPTLTGKAHFAFVARYLKGVTRPAGHTQFHFHVANFGFDSTDYDWLVISGAKARLRGVGTVNGSGAYDFELTAWDGQTHGGGGVDRFRIRITNNANGEVVYDNQMGGPDNADPTTALGGGNILIQKK